MMNIYKLEKPAKWSAGKCGNESFYFSCAECGNEEIAGFIGNGPTFEEIAIIGNGFPYKPAMFCQSCLTKRILKEQITGEYPVKETEMKEIEEIADELSVYDDNDYHAFIGFFAKKEQIGKEQIKDFEQKYKCTVENVDEEATGYNYEVVFNKEVIKIHTCDMCKKTDWTIKSAVYGWYYNSAGSVLCESCGQIVFDLALRDYLNEKKEEKITEEREDE